jgi:hypothetical protein
MLNPKRQLSTDRRGWISVWDIPEDNNEQSRYSLFPARANGLVTKVESGNIEVQIRRIRSIEIQIKNRCVTNVESHT